MKAVYNELGAVILKFACHKDIIIVKLVKNE
jgi:hypothetical protein